MDKSICIVCHGSIHDKGFHAKVLTEADIIICADGGANHCQDLGFVPDYVIGDMDSVDRALLDRLSAKVIYDADQSKTDLELAIALAESLRPAKITILGAIGTRMDHTLANIYALSKIRKEISARILDEYQEIVVARSAAISGKPGDTVSILPLDNIKGLTYRGLKWPMNDMDVPFNWTGISNVLTQKKATVTAKSGMFAVIKVHRL